MEMRVEQLSVRSGVAVDTIRYYQSKGLLDPPRREGRVAWYDDTHLERLERVRSLQQRGFTLATIVRLVDGALDAADEALIGELSGTSSARSTRTAPPSPSKTPAPVGATVAAEGATPAPDEEREEATFTLGQLATETGVPLALLKAIEAEGLLIPQRRGDHDLYTEEDVAACRAGLLLLEWGIPLSALVDVARRHHQATEMVAREAVAMFSAHVRAPLRHGMDPRDVGPDRRAGSTAPAGPSTARTDPHPDVPDGTESEIHDLLVAYQQLLPAVTTLVGHHFNRALVQAALHHVEQVGSDEERRAVWDQAGRGPLSAAGIRVARPDVHAPASRP